MIVLLDAAGASVTFTAVWCVWQARRLWLYWQRPQRVIRGQVEPPRQVYGTPANEHPAHTEGAPRWGREEPRRLQRRASEKN